MNAACGPLLPRAVEGPEGMTPLEAVTQAALAISLFVTYLLLWLGITTLFAARRRHTFGRAAGVAPLLGSAFFLHHAMLVRGGPPAGAIAPSEGSPRVFAAGGGPSRG